jgi:hypothetical protein
MRKTLGVAAFAACVLGVISCDAEPTTPKSFTVFTGVMNSSKEVPTNAATATGTLILTLNEKNQLTYNVHWMGLTGAATGAHIHGPADAATNAGIIVSFSPTSGLVPATPAGAGNPAYSSSAVSGGASGTIKLDTTFTYSGAVRGDSLLKLLNAGLLYINVHTAANAGGEIRAQVIKQ